MAVDVGAGHLIGDCRQVVPVIHSNTDRCDVDDCRTGFFLLGVREQVAWRSLVDGAGKGGTVVLEVTVLHEFPEDDVTALGYSVEDPFLSTSPASCS